MARKLANFSFVAVFLWMAWRLFALIDHHAVDLPFQDHWDYLIGFLEERSLADLFLHQHGPHRQGVGYLLTKVVGEATGLNMRAEAFAVGATVCLAGALALWWKRRLFGKFHWGDITIPLIFLTPLQWETFVVAPNPAHSAMPLLLLTALGLSCTIASRITRYAVIVPLTLCLAYTGFGIFGAGAALLLLAAETISALRHQRSAAAAPAVTTLLAALAFGSFFLGYQFVPAVSSFAFPDPNWPNYPTVAALSLAEFTWPGEPLALPVGFAVLLTSMLLCIRHGRRVLAADAQPYDAAISLLCLTTLMFVTNIAIGRISLGLDVGTASRYMTLVAPLYLGIYFVFCTLSIRRRAIVLAITVPWLAIAALVPHSEIDDSAAAVADLKRRWRANYLTTHSIEQANQAAGGDIHEDPELTNLELKLRYLELKGFSLFRK